MVKTRGYDIFWVCCQLLELPGYHNHHINCHGLEVSYNH